MATHIRADECKRWVAFRLGHLGDVALSTGVLSHLAATRGWQFVFVTRRIFADLFKHNPYVSKVICVDEDDLEFNAFKDFAKIMTGRYKDWGLLDLHGSLRSRLLTFMWKGPVRRYNKMGLERRLFLFSQLGKNGEKLREYNVPQRYYMAVQDLGGEDKNHIPSREDLTPHIWLSSQELAEARQKIDMLLGKNVKPVALHPYATHTLKTWPPERWKELAQKMEEAGIPWIMLGRGKKFFAGQSPHCLKELTNSTTLRETCAMLSWCRALVTGDSGPMHLASAVGTPVIALFGPTTTEWGFYPEGKHNIILQRDLSCRPCSLHGRKPCKSDGSCLSDITLDEVLDAVSGFDTERGTKESQATPAGDTAEKGTPEKDASGSGAPDEDTSANNRTDTNNSDSNASEKDASDNGDTEKNDPASGDTSDTARDSEENATAPATDISKKDAPAKDASDDSGSDKNTSTSEACCTESVPKDTVASPSACDASEKDTSGKDR